MIDYIKALWAIFQGPNNDPVVTGLGIACFAILAMHIRSHFLYKRLIETKDKEIERLVEEKNKLQNFLLRNHNTNRQQQITKREKTS